MYRLIHLHPHHGIPRIGVDPDGYTSEEAALQACRATPGPYFGVGRFDAGGRLAEVVMDAICEAPGGCPSAAMVVDAHTFRRLCDACAYGLATLTVPELAERLGVAVRPAPVLATSGRHAAPDAGCAAGTRIAREFATHVADPIWRMELCAELARTPPAVNGLIIGVGALSHRDVLDLFPALCALGTQLPVGIRADLRRATVRPLSPGGVAALRLGL
ncbi:hypothetical protein [Krasilnikovia sp. MM14-A1259]|uniref:hypothetical protein n=1 Tax=Krasilnikovia sp. MM14-A1259 TaxID=3373539 RepID=UPI00380D3BA1